MKTSLRLRPSLIGLALIAAYSPPNALAADNETDEQGRWIAAPAETDFVERGYLFYPLRVLPKKQADLPAVPQPSVALAPVADTSNKANTSDAAPAEVVAMKPGDEHDDGHGAAHEEVPKSSVAPVADTTSGNAANSHSGISNKAAAVLVQVVEPVKPAAPAHAHASSADAKQGDAGKDEHADSHDATPELSKAELAKAERAKAAEARAAKLKEEQEKAELAKAERAKIAQARAEKIKQEQAKAERARAERQMLAAQARVDKALDELAKAEKAFALLKNAETEAAGKANEATVKDEHAKAEPAKDKHGKDEHAKAEPAKDEPAKDDHASHAATPSVATANAPAGQKILYLNRAEPAAPPAAPEH